MDLLLWYIIQKIYRMNEEDKDPIGKALNLTPLDFEDQVERIIAKAHDDSARNDFEAARANLYEVIQTGQEAMDKLTEIAAQSQHPRAFEVLAKLMDTMVDTNKDRKSTRLNSSH